MTAAGINSIAADADGPASESRALVVIYDSGEDGIACQIAEVLGWPLSISSDTKEALVEAMSSRKVVGISNALHDLSELDSANRQSYLILNAARVDAESAPHQYLTMLCDYEYIYTHSSYLRRDLVRYLSVIMGFSNHHSVICDTSRSKYLSTTFSDVRVALNNIDILSVGLDAIELRVDLLDKSGNVPTLNYVGQQLTLLRQRSSLPIIYTTRCSRDNGKFPMDDPELYYKYLYRGKQWGCEYIDVESWLPEYIRKRLADRKGHSKIISTFHDLSGNFKWSSAEAFAAFEKGAVYGDIVKMNVRINSPTENLELERFRAAVEETYPNARLSATNTGEGDIAHPSRAFNKFLTPTTHSLLPTAATPDQQTAAEINSTVRMVKCLPEQEMYCIGVDVPRSRVMFFQRCFNELGLPLRFSKLSTESIEVIEGAMAQRGCVGASLYPPIRSSCHFLTSCSTPASLINRIDTIVAPIEQPVNIGERPVRVGENSEWQAIYETLKLDFVVSAYVGRTAIVLATAATDGAAAIYALKRLGMRHIYTIGFKACESLKDMVVHMKLENVREVQHPFVLVNALPLEKLQLVYPLLTHFGREKNPGAKVYLEYFQGSSSTNTIGLAEMLGWRAYSNSEVFAWQTAIRFKLMIGQHVPYSFVRQTGLW